MIGQTNYIIAQGKAARSNRWPSEGLSAAYLFSSGLTFSDSAGSQNLTNSSTSSVADRKGVANNAIGMHAGSASRSNFNRGSGSGVSVSVWARATVHDWNTQVFGKGIVFHTNDFKVYFEQTTALFRFEVKQTDNVVKRVTASQSLSPQNVWTHFCMATSGKAGDVMTAWINGQYVGGVMLTADAVNTLTNTLYIGAWPTGYGSNFYGEIDDVRIYNRKLLPTEIRKLYNE